MSLNGHLGYAECPMAAMFVVLAGYTFKADGDDSA